MSPPEAYSFLTYLQAKQEIDDRSLNRRVWEKLVGLVSQFPPEEPPHILELGAGYGAMSARILAEGQISSGRVTLVDLSQKNLQFARRSFLSPLVRMTGSISLLQYR